MTTLETNYDYFKELWRESEPATRRKWITFLAVLVGLWLAGMVAAASNVAAIAQMEPAARWFAALFMGPMGLLWGFFKWTGLLEETAQDPNRLWLVAAGINGGIIWLAGKILTGEPNRAAIQQRKEQAHKKAQGRLPGEEAAKRLGVEQGALVARLDAGKKKPVTIGLDYKTGEGHVLAVGPTRSGKGLNLTQTLMQWPGAAIIVDPKGEQFERTAGFREKTFGSPIYRLPGHQMHLAYYYNDLLDRDSLFELHGHFLRPEQSRERIFADKSRAIFIAAGLYGRARRLNPVRVLLDAADCDPVEVLKALESVPEAKKYVRIFTDGLPPEKYYDNRFATSAYGTFTTMLSGYQKHIDTIAPYQNSPAVIPRDWAARGATIYVTYSLNDLQGVGGVVAAIMAAFMRYQIRRQRQERILVAIDELPAVGLYNVTNYLATAGGYGITMLLYAQAVSQLRERYGPDGTQSILANSAHQLWYPPADMETARVMSELYGTTYKPVHTQGSSRRFYQGNGQENQKRQNFVDLRQAQGWELRPALSPSEMMSLPKEKVLVLTLKERQYRFIGERLNPIPLFDKLPPAPALTVFQPGPRQYTDWVAAAPGGWDDSGEDAPLAGAAHY